MLISLSLNESAKGDSLRRGAKKKFSKHGNDKYSGSMIKLPQEIAKSDSEAAFGMVGLYL